MRAITTLIYSYEELPAASQARARDWLRNSMAGETDFAETVEQEFRDLLRQCGFTVKAADISWSIGDRGSGAGFHGYWNAEGCKPHAWLADRPETCDSNKAWHAAALPLIATALAYPHATATIHQTRSFFMTLSEYDFVPLDAGVDYTAGSWRAHDSANDAAAAAFIVAVRGLADTFHRALEAEYEYATSDEAIAESIIANDYEFTHHGRIYQEQ